MPQINKKVLSILYSLHRMFKLTGFISFDMEKNGKLLKLKTLFRKYILAFYTLSYMLFNLVGILFYECPIILYFLYLFYFLGDIFKVTIFIITATLNKKNMLAAWKGIFQIDVKCSTLSGNNSYGHLKFHLMFISFYSLFRFFSIFIIINFTKEIEMTQLIVNLTYASVHTIANFMITCNIFLYIIGLSILNDQYKTMNRLLKDLHSKPSQKGYIINSVAQLHEEATWNLKQINSILSLQLLSLFAQNFWTLSANCYCLISKLYLSSLEAVDISYLHMIYWIYDSFFFLLILIYPAHICTKNVSH